VPCSWRGRSIRLLLVEDDVDLRDAVGHNLERAGFVVDAAKGLADALTAMGVQRYDAVILDLSLPDGDGLELLRRLRSRHDSTPVLILTARDTVADRVRGLESGADDYLVKPFAHEELIARLRALLRRPRADLGGEVRVGRLVFRPASGEILLDDAPLQLRRRELMVLETLMRRAGRVVSRQALAEAVWGFEDEVEPETLESHVSRVRRRLQEVNAGVELRTVRGLGYLLQEKKLA